MRKAFSVAILLVLISLPLAFFPGCGSQGQQGEEEEVVDYVIQNILIPRERDSNFLVDWRRKSSGIEDVSPDELAQRFWKWEGGALTEITAEEREKLAAVREKGDPNIWTYSQHAITVIQLDEGSNEALVEIDSLYGPVTGSGIRYLLRKEGGEWKKVAEETIWVS